MKTIIFTLENISDWLSALGDVCVFAFVCLRNYQGLVGCWNCLLPPADGAGVLAGGNPLSPVSGRQNTHASSRSSSGDNPPTPTHIFVLRVDDTQHLWLLRSFSDWQWGWFERKPAVVCWLLTAECMSYSPTGLEAAHSAHADNILMIKLSWYLASLKWEWVQAQAKDGFLSAEIYGSQLVFSSLLVSY